jgi:hypothetical protein
MIISGNSDAAVLVDQEINGGLRNFFLSGLLPRDNPTSLMPRTHPSLDPSNSHRNAWDNTWVSTRGPTWAMDMVDVRHSLFFRYRRPIDAPTRAENEVAVIRYDFNDPSFGTCKESVQGGNHFRYWVQNGASANRCVG